MAEYEIPQISTGDILRDQIARGTALGVKAKGLMDRGALVPDDVVNGMVADRLGQADIVSGYVLDGYPRTLAQAEWLDGRLSAASTELDLVAVSLRVDEGELLRRITGRRTCAACGHIYNIYSQAPAVEGRCDVDGSELVQRTDDTEEAFRARMKAYEASTAPVIEHYRAKGRFAEVDGMESVTAVTASIDVELSRLRGWEI